MSATLTPTPVPYLPGHAYAVDGTHVVAMNPRDGAPVRLRPSGDIRGPVTVMTAAQWGELAAAGRVTRTS